LPQGRNLRQDRFKLTSEEFQPSWVVAISSNGMKMGNAQYKANLAGELRIKGMLSNG